MRKRQLSIVGCVGVPNKYGGFEALAENLARTPKIKSYIYCSSKAYSEEERVSNYHNAKLHYLNLSANGVSSLIYDAFSILHAVLRGERNILCLGVSGAWVLPIVRLFNRRVKIVTNVDGLEWRREKFSKFSKLFLRFLHLLAERYSTVIICDNEALIGYITKRYRSKVVVIAYGGDQVLAEENLTETVASKTFSLAMCRIVPENNVEMILEAFRQTSEDLIFIGNWDISEYSRKLSRKYSNCQNITLMKETYDKNILQKLRKNSKFYIHGHSAGGTNPSLVEAMFICKTILYFDCDFNFTTLKQLGFPFQNSDDLSKLITSDPIDQSEQCLKVAWENYSWKIICQKYSECFNT